MSSRDSNESSSVDDAPSPSRGRSRSRRSVSPGQSSMRAFSRRSIGRASRGGSRSAMASRSRSKSLPRKVRMSDGNFIHFYINFYLIKINFLLSIYHNFRC